MKSTAKQLMTVDQILVKFGTMSPQIHSGAIMHEARKYAILYFWIHMYVASFTLKFKNVNSEVQS